MENITSHAIQLSEIAYGSLIAACVQSSSYHKKEYAPKLLDIWKNGKLSFWPHGVCCVQLMQSFIALDDLRSALEVYTLFCTRSTPANPVFAALLGAYNKANDFNGVLILFDDMSHNKVLPNQAQLSIITRAAFKLNDSDSALKILEWIVLPDLGFVPTELTFGYMITILCNDSAALEKLLFVMDTNNIMAPPQAYVASLKACIQQTNLALGRRVHKHIVERGMKPSVILYSSIMNMYTKLDSPQVQLYYMHTRNIILGNTRCLG